MSEQQHTGITATQVAARIASPEFQHVMRNSGITMEQAAANLRASARHFDADHFDALLAAYRPALWKRMNRRPSRISTALRRLRPKP